MTTETAITNVEHYIMMLEKGNATKAARNRAWRAMGYLKSNANYMKYGHYVEWGAQEDKYKQEELEHGADITPFSQVLRRNKRKQI